ncbi:portal protein [Ottowia sp. VDI28]|uniref:portal protein n=1 Tax=Ottowia sp. VDI28 TaxID=3133968 RepID=UPI003C2D387E
MQATETKGGEQPQADEQPRDLRGEFVITLLDKRKDAVNGRANSGIEEEWTEDEEHYQGIDDANRAFQNANQLYRSRKTAMISGRPTAAPTRSVIFLNITRPYTDAASARVADMLLPTDDRSWEIKPTPLPRLSQMQLTKLGEAIGVSDPVQVQAQIEARQAKAKDAAERMQRAIEDPLVESNWHGEVRQVIEDAARIGSGVLKGPFPISRTVRMTTKNPITQLTEYAKAEEIKPGSKRIDSWNFFPDPDCGENIHNGSFTFEREYIGRRQIKEMLADPSYETAELMAALNEGPSRTNDGTEAVYRPSKDEFVMWIFYGHCARETLLHLGIELDEGAEDRVPTMAVMINDRLVKTVESPIENGEFPYDVLAWQRRPGMPWGMGVSRQIRTVQRMLNGSARALMDNSGLSAAPQWIIGNGVTPIDGEFTLRPGKGWRLDTTASADDVRKAFAAFVVPSVQAELMAIINFAMQMAEDTTGMPAMLQGIRGDAPNTLGGMQMQNNNSTSVLRRLAKRFDDYMTRPHIQRYFDWMMNYSDDETIKGDFEIEVRASSALVERDAQQQFLLQMVGLARDPAYEIDPAKLFAELCKGQRLDPKNFQLDEQQKALRAQQGQDPTVQAKVKLLESQARKADADATNTGMDTLYSGVQTGQAISMNPAVAPLADDLAKSVGFVDQNAAPIVPLAPASLEPVPPVQNTNPLTPANPESPEVGVRHGIETPEADGGPLPPA